MDEGARPTPRAGSGRPRQSWWLAGALAFLLVAYIGIGHWRGEVQWRRLQAAADVLQAEYDAREPARPALFGEARAGAAWPHYQRAFSLLATPDKSGAYVAHLGRVEGARLAGVDRTEAALTGPPAAQVVADHAPALAALRAGTHMSDGRRPIDWRAGFDLHIENLLTARDLTNVCVLAAILAAGRGDGQEAVHLVLDGLQLGRDFCQSPVLIEQMIGCAVLAIGSRDVLAWSNLLHHLDPAALRALGDGLGRLDASLPLNSDWLTGEAILFAHASFDSPPPTDPLGDPFGGLAWRAWRYGFSTRLALANHGLSQLRLAAKVRTLAARDRLDVAAIERLFAEHATSTNPVTRIMMPPRSMLKNRLQAIALVRLLRMATQHAAGQQVTTLPDPSGGTLLWQIDADGDAEFWSAADRAHTCLQLRK